MVTKFKGRQTQCEICFRKMGSTSSPKERTNSSALFIFYPDRFHYHFHGSITLGSKRTVSSSPNFWLVIKNRDAGANQLFCPCSELSGQDKYSECQKLYLLTPTILMNRNFNRLFVYVNCSIHVSHQHVPVYFRQWDLSRIIHCLHK